MEALLTPAGINVVIDYGAFDNECICRFQEFSPSQALFIRKTFLKLKLFSTDDAEYLIKIEKRQLLDIEAEIDYLQGRIHDAEEHECRQKCLSLSLIAVTVALTAVTCFIGGYMHHTGDSTIMYALAIPPFLYAILALLSVSYFENIAANDSVTSMRENSSSSICNIFRLIPIIIFATCFIPTIAHGRQERIEEQITSLKSEWQEHHKIAKGFYSSKGDSIVNAIIAVVAKHLKQQLDSSKNEFINLASQIDMFQIGNAPRHLSVLVNKPNILPSIQHKDFVLQLKSLSHEELSAAIHSVHQELSHVYNTLRNFKRLAKIDVVG